MKLGNKCKRALTISLAMALVTPSTFAATKNEMVFVTASSTGKSEKIIVSNHLEINNETEIKDVSELDNIINLKGDEVPQKNGDKIIWESNGKDIYYQGTTTKKLPVDTKIKYELDGKEISSDELSGKSGHLKMVIKQTNTIKHTKNIDGKQRELYTPFYSFAVVVLDTDVMQNIKLTNAKLMSDGSKKAVVGIMLPGMDKNLGENKIDLISDTIEIEGDVEKFSLDPVYIATTSTLPELDAISETDELDKVTSSIDELQNATNDLVSGAETLSEGMENFDIKFNEFKIGISNLMGGVTSLTEGINSLYEGTKSLSLGAETLYESSVIYTKKGNQLKAGSDTQLSGITKLDNSLAQIIESLPDDLPQKAALVQISTEMNNLEGSTSELNKGISEYITKANEISAGAKKLKLGSSSLLEGVKKVNEGIAPLKQGGTSLQEGVDALGSASQKLKVGAISLSDGINKFNEEGIKKLKSELAVKLDQLGGFKDIKDALVEISNEYTTFTGNDESNSGKVCFVTKINGVNES